MNPRDRLREAIKQVEVAKDEVDGGHFADLDEVEITLRGVADRLEERAEAEQDRAELREAIEADGEGEGA